MRFAGRTGFLALAIAAGCGETDPDTPPAPRTAAIPLPVASAGVTLEAESELIVTIVNGACLVATDFMHPVMRFPSRPLTLQELGTRAEHAVTVHHKMLERKAGSGMERVGEEDLSKLRVLLRAEKNTPWKHIEWVCEVLSEARLHRIWIACQSCADASYSDAEVKRSGLRRCRAAPKETALRLFIEWQHHLDEDGLPRWPMIELSRERPVSFAGKDVPGSKLAARINTVLSGTDLAYRKVFVKPGPATPLHEVVACLNAAERARCRASWSPMIPPPGIRKLPAMPAPTEQR